MDFGSLERFTGSIQRLYIFSFTKNSLDTSFLLYGKWNPSLKRPKTKTSKGSGKVLIKTPFCSVNCFGRDSWSFSNQVQHRRSSCLHELPGSARCVPGTRKGYAALFDVHFHVRGQEDPSGRPQENAKGDTGRLRGGFVVHVGGMGTNCPGLG